jgi:hypothetical protein
MKNIMTEYSTYFPHEIQNESFIQDESVLSPVPATQPLPYLGYLVCLLVPLPDILEGLFDYFSNENADV